MVFPDPPLQDEGVKSLLHLLGAGVQFVQEQAVGFLPGYHARGTKNTPAVYDLRHADDIFGSQLTAQERNTLQPDVCGKLLHDGGFPDARRTPDEHRADGGDIQQNVSELILINCNCKIQMSYTSKVKSLSFVPKLHPVILTAFFPSDLPDGIKSAGQGVSSFLFVIKL